MESIAIFKEPQQHTNEKCLNCQQNITLNKHNVKQFTNVEILTFVFELQQSQIQLLQQLKVNTKPFCIKCIDILTQICKARLEFQELTSTNSCLYSILVNNSSKKDRTAPTSPALIMKLPENPENAQCKPEIGIESLNTATTPENLHDFDQASTLHFGELEIKEELEYVEVQEDSFKSPKIEFTENTEHGNPELISLKDTYLPTQHQLKRRAKKSYQNQGQ